MNHHTHCANLMDGFPNGPDIDYWPNPSLPGTWPVRPALPRPWTPRVSPPVSGPIVPTKPVINVSGHPLVRKVAAFVARCKEQPLKTGLVKRTHSYFILDASGSMKRDKDVTIVGYNQQVEAIKELDESAGEVSASLFVFADNVGVNYLYAPRDSLETLNDKTYRPEGQTALMDAIGAAIESALSAPGAEDPTCAFLFQTFTDGDENNSSVCYPAMIAECVRLLESTGRFTFTLIGPRESLSSMADLLSLKKGNVRGYDPTSRSEKATAFASASGATKEFFKMRSAGVTASANLYSNGDDLAG